MYLGQHKGTILDIKVQYEVALNRLGSLCIYWDIPGVLLGNNE